METQVKSATCAACKYWDSENTENGSCRRKAPQSVVFEVSSQQTIQTVFPTTRHDDWCGEFEKRS